MSFSWLGRDHQTVGWRALLLVIAVSTSLPLVADEKKPSDADTKKLEDLRAIVATQCVTQDERGQLQDAMDENGQIAPWFARVVSTWTVPAGKTPAEIYQPAVDCAQASWRLAKETLRQNRQYKGKDSDDTKDAKRRYLDVSSALASLRLLMVDPDIYDLKVRAYAATVFSNLFQDNTTPDAAHNDSFFSSPKPYFQFELSQTVFADRSLDTFSTFSFKGVAAQNGPTSADIATANSIDGEVRIAFWPNLMANSFGGVTTWGQIGVGVGVTGGFIGVPTQDDKTPSTLQGLFRAGFLARELTGHWEGSFTEFDYAKDPRFTKKSRFYARGRLVLSSLNPDVKGHGIGGFLEGSINTRFSANDPDEARVTIGAVLPLDSILAAIFPSSESKTPSTTETDTKKKEAKAATQP